MCIDTILWAFGQELPALQSLVLLRLANHKNSKTGRCYPSIPKLAQECGLSARSVINAIKALEAKKLIQVIREKMKVNHYVLACRAEQDLSEVHLVHANVHQIRAKVHHVHPNQEITQEVNPEGEPVLPDQEKRLETEKARWLLEELGVPSDSGTREIVSQAVHMLTKQHGSIQQVTEWLLEKTKAALAKGETINRFWFMDQRYDDSAKRAKKDPMARMRFVNAHR